MCRIRYPADLSNTRQMSWESLLISSAGGGVSYLELYRKPERITTQAGKFPLGLLRETGADFIR